jgi:hypothetical protein
VKTWTVLALLCIATVVDAQTDSSFRLVRTVAGDFSAFSADNLGNLYVITPGNQLKKYNPKGDSMGVFNDVRKYGKLTQIDPSSPLRTVLFYRDFKTVLVLDRLMNLVNTIDLRKQNIFQVRAVCLGYDNSIWVFDEQASRLRKVGEDGRLLSETADLRLALDEAPLPVRIFDQNRFVYLYDPQKGMYIFDYYGALKQKLPLTGWTDVQVIGKTILGRKDGRMLTYTQGTLQLEERLLPEFLANAERILLMPQGVYVLDVSGIHLYTYE